MELEIEELVEKEDKLKKEIDESMKKHFGEAYEGIKNDEKRLKELRVEVKIIKKESKKKQESIDKEKGVLEARIKAAEKKLEKISTDLDNSEKRLSEGIADELRLLSARFKKAGGRGRSGVKGAPSRESRSMSRRRNVAAISSGSSDDSSSVDPEKQETESGESSSNSKGASSSEEASE